MTEDRNGADGALLDLLHALRAQDYTFVTPTPETHKRVTSRPDKQEAADLRDIFGWSLPFTRERLPGAIRDLAERGGILRNEDHGLLRSTLRVSTFGKTLLLHSAYPTDDTHSVFFGPDSYRFADLLAAELPHGPAPRRLVDIGSGAGAGGIASAAVLPGVPLTLTDINPQALRLARINARFAGLEVELCEGSGLACVDGDIDLVIANPPYIADSSKRAYRDGGDMHGGRLSLDWAIEAAQRLTAAGRMILYTGSAIVAGNDPLRQALEERLPAFNCSLRYRELDPDVFGEELERPEYADVERIAVIGAIISKG